MGMTVYEALTPEGLYAGHTADLLSEATTVGYGEAAPVGPFRTASFHVVITGGIATVTIEGTLSANGAITDDWFEIASVSESTAFPTDIRMTYVRARIDAITAGTVSTHYLGFKG